MEYISHTYWGCYSEVAHLCKKEKVRVTFLISRDKNRRIDSHQVHKHFVYDSRQCH